LIMTGSHSLDIRKASETLPGRRGDTSVSSLDKILLPMKFSEYVDTKDPELERTLLSYDLRKQETRRSLLESLQKGDIPKTIREIYLFLGDLNKHLNNYLLTGGIVRAINDQEEYGEISDGTYSTYLSVTRGDILRYGKNESYMVQLLVRLNETLCSQVSWRALQNNTDIGSPNTVAEYVDVLKASYIVNPIYVIDSSKGRPNYGKEKKIHFTDPFIFHTLRGWIKQAPYYEEAVRFNESDEVSKLIECVVGDHLTRLAYTLHPVDGFDASNHVMYWKDGKGELDFVLRYGEGFMPFEVKYTSSIDRGDLNGLYRFTRSGLGHKGIVVTRDMLKTVNGVTEVPASIFLLLV
jgi:predicted AAA+ superfamily ATPase